MKARKNVSFTIFLAILLSLSFVSFSVDVQAQDLATMTVEPSFIFEADVGEFFDVSIMIYDADITKATDVYAYQVCMTWDAAVLDISDVVTWGDFLDVPRIGYWGELTADAASGQKQVNVQDGSKYTVGYDVLIQDDSNSEWNVVASRSGNLLVMQTDLVNTYTVAANGGCYPQPNITPSSSVNPTRNRIIAGQTSEGPAPGVSGSGWLCNFTMEVLTVGETALQIDHSILGQYTYIINTLGETLGDDPDELLKESSYYGTGWAEDLNKDGIIDIFDIAMCAIWFGEPVTYTNVPSQWAGGWTNPGNVVASDDLYASTSGKNVIETYGDYGFNPGGWKSVTSLEVGIEHISAGGEMIYLTVSGDGGGSWGAAHILYPGTTDTFEWVDVTADLTWTPGMMTLENFLVRIEHVVVGGAKTTGVDYLPVRVVFRPLGDVDGDGDVDIVDLTEIALLFGEEYA